jgi:hypothetical protein
LPPLLSMSAGLPDNYLCLPGRPDRVTVNARTARPRASDVRQISHVLYYWVSASPSWGWRNRKGSCDRVAALHQLGSLAKVVAMRGSAALSHSRISVTFEAARRGVGSRVQNRWRVACIPSSSMAIQADQRPCVSQAAQASRGIWAGPEIAPSGGDQKGIPRHARKHAWGSRDSTWPRSREGRPHAHLAPAGFSPVPEPTCRF